MSVVDKVVDDDHDLSSPAISNLLPFLSEQRHCPAPQRATRDAFVIFEDICMLGSGERPQFLHLKYLHKTFSLDLIESVLTNYLEVFCKVRVPSSSFHTSSPYIAFMFTAPATLTLIKTPPLPTAPQNASECSASPLTLSRTRVAFLSPK